MSNITLSMVLPTITERERWRAKAVMSFYDTIPAMDAEIVTVMDKPTCGEAWNEGVQRARGDYILLSADDITFLPNWFEKATPWVDTGFIPCPRVLNPDGTLQSCGSDAEEHPTGTPSDLARVPFLSKKQAEAIFPILPIHYFTDYWITHRGRQNNWPTVVVRDFQLVHHFAPEGRLDERLYPDKEVFDAALGGIRHYT